MQNVDVALLQEAALQQSHAHATRDFCVRQDRAALHVVALTAGVTVEKEAALGQGTVLPVYVKELGLRILNAHAVCNRETGESHDYQGFRRCVEAIEHYCDRHDGPLLVVGDFNASVHLKYDARQFERLFQRLAAIGLHDQACGTECESTLAGMCRSEHASTRTYRNKDFRIDYCFTNNAARARTSSTTVGEHCGLSDHRPLFVEVKSAELSLFSQHASHA